MRSRKQRHQPIARCLVSITLLNLSNLAQQPAQDRAMNASIRSRERVLDLVSLAFGTTTIRGNRKGNICLNSGALLFGKDLGELPVNVSPFAHPCEGKKVGFAIATQRIAAATPFSLRTLLPHFEERQKVRIYIGKLLMRRLSRFLLLLRPLSGIRNTESGGDHEDLWKNVFLAGLKKHAPESRI